MTAKPTPQEIARAAAYVRSRMGARYKDGAFGPDEFSCWGLAHDCERELFGRELPVAASEAFDDIIAVVQHPETRAAWPIVHKPVHGALAVMSNSIRKHIGVWLYLDGGGVFHIAENAGVKFETPLMLRAQGWCRPYFHAYAGARP